MNDTPVWRASGVFVTMIGDEYNNGFELANESDAESLAAKLNGYELGAASAGGEMERLRNALMTIAEIYPLNSAGSIARSALSPIPSAAKEQKHGQ